MSPPLHDAVVCAPGFALGVRCTGTLIIAIDFLPADTAAHAPRSGPADLAARQLEAYLRDPDSPFDLPLAVCGTLFRRRVWQAIAAVPRGRVARYGELARALGSSARAVGQACGDNPYPVVVPCHRIVAAGGLGGFAHGGDDTLLGIKRWLLRHEGARTP